MWFSSRRTRCTASQTRPLRSRWFSFPSFGIHRRLASGCVRSLIPTDRTVESNHCPTRHTKQPYESNHPYHRPSTHGCATVPLARSGGRRQDTTSKNHHVPQPIAYPFSSLLCALLDSSGEICVIGCVSRGQGRMDISGLTK